MASIVLVFMFLHRSISSSSNPPNFTNFCQIMYIKKSMVTPYDPKHTKVGQTPPWLQRLSGRSILNAGGQGLKT